MLTNKIYKRHISFTNFDIAYLTSINKALKPQLFPCFKPKIQCLTKCSNRAGDEKQNVEGHRRVTRHRGLIIGRLHAPEALHEELASVRMPLRPRRHRPTTHHQPGGSVNQEEEREVE